MRRVVIAIAIASVVAIGCKRHKPPAMTRVWLGPSHGCAALKTGGLACWGANDAGQLGDGTTLAHAVPARVEGAATPDDLAIGARHTCGRFGGRVSCWGDGSRGQLGTGATASLSKAGGAVVADGGELESVSAIAAGGDQTCAIAPRGVRCWGEGRLTSVQPPRFEGRASHVAVGPRQVCAAFTEPTKMVRCAASAASTGEGTPDVGAPLLTGASIAGLAVGDRHACALLENGSVTCWGENESGQLGDGTTMSTRTPAPVNGFPPVAEIRAGANHTCARLRNNTIACWGKNDVFQLANGTTVPSAAPVPLRGLVGVMELAVAGSSACVRLADGNVRCWGSNASGQLADGTKTDHNVPMPLRSLPPAN